MEISERAAEKPSSPRAGLAAAKNSVQLFSARAERTAIYHETWLPSRNELISEIFVSVLSAIRDIAADGPPRQERAAVAADVAKLGHFELYGRGQPVCGGGGAIP